MSHKLNLSHLPSWDGEGTSVIDYIASMAVLARLSEPMKIGIARLAAQKWTGPAQRWWMSITPDEQMWFSQDWDYMVWGIRGQFLDHAWFRAREREFEEMKFRSRGLDEETPVDFMHRRIRYHSFLFSEDDDGPAAISRILRTMPVEWRTLLNEETCPSRILLIKAASKHAEALIGQYHLSEQIRGMSTPRPFRRFASSKNKSANVVSQEKDSDDGTSDLEPEEEAVEDEKEVLAVQSKRTFKRSKKPMEPRNKDAFPQGKTVNGYHFARDDSVSSIRPPNGTCYICTSPKHIHRDCPHFGKFSALRSANVISVEWDANEEQQVD